MRKQGEKKRRRERIRTVKRVVSGLAGTRIFHLLKFIMTMERFPWIFVV